MRFIASINDSQFLLMIYRFSSYGALYSVSLSFAIIVFLLISEIVIISNQISAY